MPQLIWKDRPAADFDSLIGIVPNDALDSPRRSVVPLLDFCREPATAAAHLGRALNADLSGMTEMVFEFPVPVHKGQGKPSFTDLLIKAPDTAVGIEAKYTEPEYESVRKWRREPVDDNRSEVLDGWLDLLNKAATRPVVQDDILDLPYQLIHRVASACYPKCARRYAAYLLFGDAAPHYAKHMASLAALLDPSAISLSVLSCSLAKSPEYRALEQRWDTGERNMADSVRAALREVALFEFGSITVAWSTALTPIP